MMSLLKHKHTLNLIKTVAFLTGFAVIYFFLAKAADPAYDMNINNHKSIMMSRENLEQYAMIVLGSSHAHSLWPDRMGIEGLKLGAPGADMFELNKKVGYALRHMPNLETICITVSPFTFSWDNAAYSTIKGNFKSRRRHLYTIYTDVLPIPGDEDSYVMAKLFPVVNHDHWEKVFYKKNVLDFLEEGAPLIKNESTKEKKKAKKSDPFAPMKRAIRKNASNIDLSQLSDKQEKKFQNVKRHSIGRTIGFVRQMENMKQNHQNLEADVVNATKSIIAKCKANNVRLIFYTPPYFTTFSAGLKAPPEGWEESPFNQLHRIMSDLQRKHDVEYYDFHDHPEFFQNADYFKNSDHLTPKGSVDFSRLFKKVVFNKKPMP